MTIFVIVSSYFGFGLLDIGALVEKCKVWENVPQVMNCSASNNRRRPYVFLF